MVATGTVSKKSRLQDGHAFDPHSKHFAEVYLDLCTANTFISISEGEISRLFPNRTLEMLGGPNIRSGIRKGGDRKDFAQTLIFFRCKKKDYNKRRCCKMFDVLPKLLKYTQYIINLWII
jgi:hypothetical protein